MCGYTLAGETVRGNGLAGLRVHHRIDGADHVVSGGWEVGLELKDPQFSIYSASIIWEEVK